MKPFKRLWAKTQAIIFLSMLAIGLSLPVGASIIDEAKQREVLIPAGSITLGATLYTPKNAKGPVPAIVTAHGSAPSTRDGVGFYTANALRLGFAVLSFDKRGTGKSTGQYAPFSVDSSDRVFRDLASDVEFSVRWVAEQEEIDSKNIGLFGGSQAGWIMPLAASREPLVKFIIVGEGTPLSAYEEQFHSDITGDEEWHAVKVLEADTALQELALPRDLGFDPTPVLEKLTTPTLWIFGLRDPVIPVHGSIGRLEHLIKTGKTNNDLVILPFGDHNFLNVATGKRYPIAKIAGSWLMQLKLLP